MHKHVTLHIDMPYLDWIVGNHAQFDRCEIQEMYFHPDFTGHNHGMCRPVWTTIRPYGELETGSNGNRRPARHRKSGNRALIPARSETVIFLKKILS
jgi:hypothetical protein